MSTLTVQTISNGTVSTSSANVIQGSAKAWVNFNGSGGASIRASYNVSSVTRVSSGRYTITYTNAFADSNYAVVMYNSASTGTNVDSFNNNYIGGASGRTTTNITVISYSNSEVDSAFFDVVIFR